MHAHIRLCNVSNRSRSREIDFVAEKCVERLYVQVAMTIPDKATADREYGNLAAISDNYEKIVATYRDSFPNTFNGIKTLTLREFLATLT